MKELLKTRGHLFTAGLDGIINPLLKLEREKGAKMLVELMKMIISTGFCPAEWKNARIFYYTKIEKEKTQEIGDQ
jgi:uncharacterized membrane protein